MIRLEPIEFPGMEEVINNSEYYKDKFIKESVICFRNANLTKEEQYDFNARFGEKIGWQSEVQRDKYVENHSRVTNSAGQDEILVGWHVEHPYYKNPIVTGTWNMYKFTADPESGKTYFVDTGSVYDMLSDEEKDFLLNSSASWPESIQRQSLNPDLVNKEISVVHSHWLTGRPILRFLMCPRNVPLNAELVHFKNEIPNSETKEYFVSLIKKITREIMENEDIRIVHRWQQGDLIIADLHRLAHAVTGGFRPEDREFCGIWGYQIQ